MDGKDMQQLQNANDLPGKKRGKDGYKGEFNLISEVLV